MAKVPTNSSLLFSRRSYALLTAENARVQSATSTMTKAAESNSMRTEREADQQKEFFWMRDPKTGNWIPESHFGEIDVAELREKVLSKKDKI